MVLRKVEGGWAIFSEKTGKRISRVFPKKSQAIKRLREIEFFKRKGK